jgi:hypothetical protein
MLTEIRRLKRLHFFVARWLILTKSEEGPLRPSAAAHLARGRLSETPRGVYLVHGQELDEGSRWSRGRLFDERETSMLIAIKNNIWVVLVSAGVGAVALAIAHAAIPDSSGVIHGCYRNHDGSLRVVDDPTTCKHKRDSPELETNWPAGTPGPSRSSWASGSSGRSWHFGEQPRV